MLKIKKDSNAISVYDLKPGDIAVIIKNPGMNYVGKCVQRYKDSLVVLGEKNGWDDFYTAYNNTEVNRFLVKVLPSGTELIIELIID